MTRITIQAQDPPATLAVSLDGDRLELAGGGTRVHVSPGHHVLSVRAQDTPGAAFTVAITDPPELAFALELVAGSDGRVAVQHHFHVGGGARGGDPGSDWPGPRAIDGGNTRGGGREHR